MAGRPAKNKQAKVGPFLGGINRSTPITQLQPNEVWDMLNYMPLEGTVVSLSADSAKISLNAESAASPVVEADYQAVNNFAEIAIIPIPANVQPNDMLLFIGNTLNGNSFIPPPGWTLIAQRTETSTCAAYYKIATADEASLSPYYFGITPSPEGDVFNAWMGRITGVDVNNPIDQAVGNVGGTSASSMGLASITPTGINSLLIAARNPGTTSPLTSATVPSGMTEVFNYGTGVYMSLQVARENLPTTAATGTKTFNFSPAQVNRAGVMFNIKGAPTVTQNKGLHDWSDADYNPRLILTRDASIHYLDASNIFQPVTGTYTITEGFTGSVIFNDRMFLTNGEDPVIAINRSLVGSVPAFTGPTPDTSILSQAWSYKRRLYFTEKDSSAYWYGGIDAISGALTRIDLASVTKTNGKLLFGINWSSNQGNIAEEFCAFVFSSGEILIYGGDFPAAPNWQLLYVLEIPKPRGIRAYCHLGGDVAIYCVNGVTLLSSAVASGANPAAIFNVTKKIQELTRNFSASGIDPFATIAADKRNPFLYVPVRDVDGYRCAVLNYETGSWGTFKGSAFAPLIYSVCYSDQLKAVVTGNEGTSNQFTVVQDPYLPGNNQSSARRITTGWVGLEDNLKKKINIIRYSFASFLGRPPNPVFDPDGFPVPYTITIVSDDGGVYTETQTITLTNTLRRYWEIEFTPNIIGSKFQISIGMEQQANINDQVVEMDIFYETGGLY